MYFFIIQASTIRTKTTASVLYGVSFIEWREKHEFYRQCISIIQLGGGQVDNLT